MKSKMKRRLLAVVLCMVIMLSNSSFIFASGGTDEAVTASQENSQQDVQDTQTETSGTSTETGVSAQSETATLSETQETEATPNPETTPEPTAEPTATPTPEVTAEPTATPTPEATAVPEVTGSGETEEQTQSAETITTDETQTEVTTTSKETDQQMEQSFQGVYEDDTVIISVSAEMGIVPEDAVLSVIPIEKTEITDDMTEEEKTEAEKVNARYDLTEKKLTENSEENEETMEGFLAYDISFLVNGEEVEPTGDVNVTMEFKEAAVPEGVSGDAEVSVKHLREEVSAEDGVVVEDMTDKSSVQTTEKAEVQKIELTSDSFSTYALSWSVSTYVDDTPTILADTTIDASVTVGDSVTLYGLGTDGYGHQWISSNTNILRVTEDNQVDVTINGRSIGTVTLTHKYRNRPNGALNEETFTVEVIDYIKVYVYVAGSGISDECLELLGIDRSTLDGNGYFPAGEIHLDPEFLENKSGAETPGEALITSQADWTELLAALSQMDTSTLIDQTDSVFSGLAPRYRLDYSQNAENSLPEYYEQAVTDVGYTWGSQHTALFRWHDDPSFGNAQSNDYRGHYGFADQSVKYHLDLRFRTNTIRFILGNNNITYADNPNAYDGLQVDTRTYITGSEIQDPRNLKIPDGYYFDGFYEDPDFDTPWDGIGTPITEDETVYIKLSRYPVLTLTKIFDGLSDAEVNYLMFEMSDGFGWDINYCNENTHQSTTGSSNGETYMETDIPANFTLPDGTKVSGGGDFRITADQFLRAGTNGITSISGVEDIYVNSMTGATLYKNDDGNWVYSISLEVPSTENDQFYTVFEQHQEVPGYAKINDSSAEWEIRQSGRVVDSGTGKFIDNYNNNIYESMSEINNNSTTYQGTTYNEMEDVCIAVGAFKRIKITESTTITFTNHYKGDLKVTKDIGNSNQYSQAGMKEYRITIQPADMSKLRLSSSTSHGLNEKVFAYEIINADGSIEPQDPIRLDENGTFEILIQPGQIAHFIDMPAIQWQAVEDATDNAVEGYTLSITYADDNNSVVNNNAHWNEYEESGTIGGASDTDGIASVDNAVRDNTNNPVVNADAVAEITVTNSYTPVTGNLTITKEVTGVDVTNKAYTFTISTNNALVAGQSYEIGDTETVINFSTTAVEELYTATVTVITTTNNGEVDGSIIINGLPAGSYTVTENEISTGIDGYQLVSIVYKQGEDDTSGITITGGETSQLDVINTYVKQWQLVKISSSTGDNGQKLYLGGAEFTASNSDQSQTPTTYYGRSEDETGIIYWYGNNSFSEESLIGTMLPDGIYSITETKTPTGYMIPADGWTLEVTNGEPTVQIGGIKVDVEQTGSLDIYYLENEALYELPSAGGPGVYMYIISGILLMSAGVLMIYKNKRKEVLGS